jgi:supervillin
MSGVKRPDFGFIARVNQNMETILFKQKFADWPDIKIQVKNGIPHVDCNEIEQIDGAHLFRSYVYEEPNLILENSCLGRGSFYFDEDTRRYFEIITVSVKKWHANSYGNEELSSEFHPHFYATEAYTVLWKYQINITVRELSGKVSSRNTVGRDRYVYFNWQGVDASASERGTSTLQMVELDKEKGSQMIINQYHEIPAFVRMFKTIFVHKKRMDESRYNSWRMYLITGGCDEVNEAIALEVPCELKQLRSRACIFLVHGKNGQIVLWKGSKTSEHQQKIALSVCSKLCGKKYSEFFAVEKIRLREYVEGQESSEFYSTFSDNIAGTSEEMNRRAYNSLMAREESFDFTPRMYELTSKNGSFEAIEVVPHLRSKDHYTAFPFVQMELYNARQPTLFLIDNGYVLYLWQGWWPKTNDDTNDNNNHDEVDVNNVENRAGENRWHLERCEAMQTALDYWKQKCGHNEKYRKNAFIVTAGYEPIEFQTIFPEWHTHDDIIEINSQVSLSSITFCPRHLINALIIATINQNKLIYSI